MLPAIYSSSTLTVEATINDLSRFEADGCDLVTFEPLARRPDNVPFGARFADRYALNALHIVPIGADWYQYADLPDCLSAVEKVTGSHATITGSSMGGYAACTYGDAFPGRKIVAISPQYSIRRDVVPFERRWAPDAERIKFLPDDGKICQSCHIWLLYDPKNPDGIHAEMIAERAGQITLVEVPGGGHPVGPVMVEAGCLSKVLLKVIQGEPSREALSAIILERIGLSPLHHAVLAAQDDNQHREEHILRGLAISPDHIKLHHALALWLMSNRRPSDALPHFEYVVSHRPFHDVWRVQYLQTCKMIGAEPDPLLAERPERDPWDADPDDRLRGLRTRPKPAPAYPPSGSKDAAAMDAGEADRASAKAADSTDTEVERLTGPALALQRASERAKMRQKERIRERSEQDGSSIDS